MGLESHTRITEDAVTRMLEEVVKSSDSKGGKNSCVSGGASAR